MTFQMNEENARLIADYIAIRFEQEANDTFDQKFKDNLLDYEFELASGQMKVDEFVSANTNWKFDIVEDRIWDAVEAGEKTVDQLSDDDRLRYNGYRIVKDFQDYLITLEDYSEEQEASIISFYLDICEIIQNDYIDKIRDGIRRAVLKQQPKMITPLDTIKVVNAEIGESDDAGTIVIKKSLPQDVAEAGGTSILPELMRISRETGQSFEEIIDEQKEAGNEMFQYVDGIERKKTIFDCSLDLFVDYSPRPQEEVAALLAQGEKPE